MSDELKFNGMPVIVDPNLRTRTGFDWMIFNPQQFDRTQEYIDQCFHRDGNPVVAELMSEPPHLANVEASLEISGS